MFSYRHAYHAGNHADVLKHLCQMLLLEKLAEKDKPFVYVDTHSGAGWYDLTSEQAQKTAEYQGGVDRMLDAKSTNPQVQAYLKLMQDYRQQNRYPGSPEIANRLCRARDSLHLMEWHNNEIQNLKRNFKGVSRAHIHHRNGFEGLVAMCPPKPARGLVLIDPSYELESDYQEVVKTVTLAVKRWATGIYAIWYPLLAKKRDRSNSMLTAFSKPPFTSVLDIQLIVQPQNEEVGMYGSGLVVVNPPWQFDQQVQALLPELSQTLKTGPEGQYSLRWLINAG
ncbi:23S rRNA (adenine(2030)-N(6))-methyltransferase RlmJ [Bowmanella dokdonensis]|uniref:Ribosomal RNA large subunit methyltransferase J n=1 Tax=Bowmanella dokdonensis TaxID=751969 RepID=A0A939DLB4_9ALTE|nr:23S rRNA (adenine(2030)-N(6))-methyltransferase RlmJ [Bowmanella dokdonensis]MBN7824397.1 23S rRNA (adenine(2030)-N(6))-methyltransferase RlmJ [Bowmanella dokdonensis]